MAKVFPFRALMYNPQRIPDIQTVVTQPYDKISPQMQARYYELSPYNLVRIIRGQTSAEDNPQNNVYTRAQEYFNAWRAQEILQPVGRPAFYAYTQRYVAPGTSEVRTRKGFIGAGQLEEYENRVVFRHERTLTGPKADRLELLRATHAHFGQIFMLYSDPQGAIDRRLELAMQGPPAVQVVDEYETTHSLWVIDQPELVAQIQSSMADKNLIIADGHHRYETALAFRNEARARAQTENRPLPESYDRLMMTFINMEGAGLTILPTHRLIAQVPNFAPAALLERLRTYFDVQEYPFTAADQSAVWSRFRQDLRRQGAEGPAIGLYAAGKHAYHLLRLRPGQDMAAVLPGVSPRQYTLDIVILHQLILQRGLGISDEAVARESNITYWRETEPGLQQVDQGAAQAFFILNPTRIEQVRDISFAQEVLPQKSTDFYPKLLSGLTIFDLDHP